ncbi:hypothetical protein MMC21_007533 [Puttea exsequens]|nr:hypothetical protein [Puttea exsequens]
MRESMDGFASANRPLTDVKEEAQDKDEDIEMTDGFNEGQAPDEDILSKTPEKLRAFSHYRATSDDISSAYNFHDEAPENDFAPNPCAKRQRADDSPMSPMDGLRSRMPSISRGLSRKFRSRKASPTIFIPERSYEASMSRANSTRAPSLSGSITEAGDTKQVQLPPTPTQSPLDKAEEAIYELRQNSSMEEEEVVDHDAKPTTPLLPPLLTQIPAHIREVPYQSPLQSPSVAKSEAPSVRNSPLPTPRIVGLPSPPLSSKPSVASFHHQRGLNPVSPTAEIPPMLITDPHDHWADQLGHANFDIEPQPYLPSENTMVTCKDLNADWNLARHNYQQHLERICENYGSTSKIFRLTEEKWSEIDAKWRRNLELVYSHSPSAFAIENGPVLQMTSSIMIADPTKLPTALSSALKRGPQRAPNSTTHSPPKSEARPTPIPEVADIPINPPVQDASPIPPSRKPSLGVTPAVAKFPSISEKGVIGPMEQGPALCAELQPQRRKRKLTFFQWVQGVWPGSGNNLVRRTSGGSQ